MVEVQRFEEEAIPILKPVVQTQRYSYRPLISALSEPVDVLHCESVDFMCAFKELRGSWSYVRARRGTPEASRAYSVRFGPLAARNVPVFLFKDKERIAEAKTDKNGRVVFELPAEEPAANVYTVSLLPKLTPFKNPLQDIFKFTVWLVTCRVRNRTDRWWRLAGRSFTDELPRIFWREAPWTVIGLAAPYGTQIFVDAVPVFGDRAVNLRYGISAWCNTPEPYPPREKCLAYRRNTWWRFEVEAFNGKVRKKVSGDLNIDRQLRVTFTTDDVRGEVVRSAGAET